MKDEKRPYQGQQPKLSPTNPGKKRGRPPKLRLSDGFIAAQSEQALRQKMLLLEKKKQLIEGLPHLYKFKWYKWSREFFESRAKINLLTAGNQLGKSSTQIRKVIEWATNQSLWPSLWRDRPTQFHYFYPTSALVKIEFSTKWMQFLPCNGLEKDPVYGWNLNKNGKEIVSIDFNSGVKVYFKSYAQAAEALQAATVYAMFCDEEVPVDLYPEMIFRLAATQGYYHSVFTATQGQAFWRQVMEPIPGVEEELLPDAKKWQISAYECLKYEDGSPSFWTEELIAEMEAKCQSKEEVLRRVYGKFVGATKQSRIFPTFKPEKHFVRPLPIEDSESIYVGVDIGSGGTKGHPSAIVFLAVDKHFKKARVVKCWRGDGEVTTASDVVDKVLEMKKGYKVVAIYYDYSSADFLNISTRMNLAVVPADKGNERGVHIINTLFQTGMLTVEDDSDQAPKLVSELLNLRVEQAKNKRVDHLCFVAGTKIATPQGDRPIEALRVGDWVLTASGKRKIVATHNRLALVIDRGALKGTRDHPVFSLGSGLIPLQDVNLCRAQRLSCKEWIRWHVLKGLNSWVQPMYSWEDRESIIWLTTGTGKSERGPKGFTSLFGSILAEKCVLRTAMFIIRTVILSTIAMKTWSVYQLKNTRECLKTEMLKKIKSIWMRSDRKQLSGIRLKKGKIGIEPMLKTVFGRVRFIPESAFNVSMSIPLKNLRENSVQTLAGKRIPGREKPVGTMLGALLEILTRIVGPIPAYAGFVRRSFLDSDLKADFVLNRVKTSTATPFVTRNEESIEKVYSLEVETDHVYYANGFLVSNCDALRYAASKVPWDWSSGKVELSAGESPESLLSLREIQERQRKEFVLGQREQDAQNSLEAEFQEIEDLLYG